MMSDDTNVIVAVLQEQTRSISSGMGRIEGKVDLMDRRMNDIRDSVFAQINVVEARINMKIDQIEGDIVKRSDDAEKDHASYESRLTALETNIAWFKWLWAPAMSFGSALVMYLLTRVMGG